MRYFFEVGEYVSYIDNNNEVKMGVVTKIEGEVITVFFKYPERYTMDIYEWALDPVTLDEYLGYEKYHKEQELFVIENPVIEKLANEDKSIEQLIDELMEDTEMMKALEVDLSRMLQEQRKERIDYVYTSPMFTVPTFGNHPEWREALKQQYIEMALATGDREWFMELTKEE